MTHEPATFLVQDAADRGACNSGLRRLARVLGYPTIREMLDEHHAPVPVSAVVDDDDMWFSDDTWYAMQYAMTKAWANLVEGSACDLAERHAGRFVTRHDEDPNMARYFRACMRMMVEGRINP